MKRKIRWDPQPEFRHTDERPRSTVCVKAGTLHWRGEEIDYPEGWTSDMASVPRMFQWLVPRFGLHGVAALGHDRALDIGWPRDKARRLMVEMLEEDDRIPWWRRRSMIAGVWAGDAWLKATRREHRRGRRSFK